MFGLGEKIIPLIVRKVVLKGCIFRKIEVNEKEGLRKLLLSLSETGYIRCNRNLYVNLSYVVAGI